MSLAVVDGEVEAEEPVCHEARPANRTSLSPGVSLGVRRGVGCVCGRKEEAEVIANETNIASSRR